jgi:hypothetical protein
MRVSVSVIFLPLGFLPLVFLPLVDREPTMNRCSYPPAQKG